VMVYLLANNLFLLRFTAPVNPLATLQDYTLDQQYAFYRFTIELIAGVAFTLLNVAYLASLWRDHSRRGYAQEASTAEASDSRQPDHPSPRV